MTVLDGRVRDTMQVCRNGHVINDLLHSCPERSQRHCDRCGAGTLDHCATCGQELPGAVYVPGLVPVGVLQPPQFCAACGAPFPWAARPAEVAGPWAVLEPLLRRLPRVIRQLRYRQGDRPPLRVEDERDLEDLLRALLPLHFDEVRPESRTPSYVTATRTDLLLAVEAIAITVKRVVSCSDAQRLGNQLREDVAYYGRARNGWTLIGLVYDPEQLLPAPDQFELD